MKRTLSLLLVLVLLAGLFPTALAASAPVTSSNLNDHFYINAGRFYHPIYSNLAWENGSYVRAEAIGSDLVVETYDQDFNFVSGKTIELELPVFGGVRMDTDYNFVVVGQENPTEDDSVEVFRIIRYTKDWKKVDHASLFGANTYIPFDAGSLRFDRSGDILYIRTAHEMYADENGTHHQANVMISVRISDMTVTDELTRVLNRNYGYVSHSFNQFVRVDGDTLLAVDHGDALPRSVVLFKYPYKAGSETFYGKTTMVNVLPIADSTYHYNDTGVSVGGFECSSTDYLVAGSAYDMSEEVDLMYAHRNIFVTATPKNNFTDEGTVLHWLTDYSEADGVEVSPPHMLKVSADKFLLTWTEDGTLKYCFVNGKGQLDGSVKTMSGSLSDCVPIRAGRYAVWYVTNGSAPKFYRIELEACTHSYTSKVTAPTCTDQGYTTHTCANCGDSYVDSYTTALGHSYGEWYTVQEPTCAAPGTQRRDCTRCDAYETGSLEPVDHDYRSTVTDPTCTDQGYTTHTCANCGDSYVDSYTTALGHDWDAGVVIVEPTEEESGLRRHTCQRCQITEDREIPRLDHTHKYDSVTTAPTCTDQGYTTHTCSCGDSYVDSYVPALGHAYDTEVTAPTCTEQGYTTHTCSRCSDRYVDSYTDALGHSYGEWYTVQEPTCAAPGTQRRDCDRCDAYETGSLETVDHDYRSTVTEPTCTEQGYTTHTCADCGDSYVDSYTAALGHYWDAGVVIVEPTEEESGLRRHTCQRCQITEDRVIPPLDHTHKYDSVTTAPTCTEQGYTTHTCSCGDSYVDSYVPALGHAYDTEVTAPTCTERGYTTHTCSRCSDRYVDSYTAALGHEYRDYKCIRCEELEPMPFEDVRQGDYYHIPVMWAVDNGITTGATETTFAPEKTATRAEVITFIWRANGEPEPTSTHNPFTDVKEGRFYYKAVLWAVEQGITTGTSATTFSPHDECSRCQVVAFLWRVEGEPEAEYNDAFDDVAEGKWYAEPISWALEMGITTGISENEFGVHVPCNRAQIVTFLYRAYAK